MKKINNHIFETLRLTIPRPAEDQSFLGNIQSVTWVYSLGLRIISQRRCYLRDRLVFARLVFSNYRVKKHARTACLSFILMLIDQVINLLSYYGNLHQQSLATVFSPHIALFCLLP